MVTVGGLCEAPGCSRSSWRRRKHQGSGELLTRRPDGSVPRHLCAAIVTVLDTSLPVQTTEDDRRALRINEHVGFQKLHQYDA